VRLKAVTANRPQGLANDDLMFNAFEDDRLTGAHGTAGADGRGTAMTTRLAAVVTWSRQIAGHRVLDTWS
jgi:hypothetical protein